MIRLLFHAIVFLFLTIISQVGGIAWLLALYFKHRVLSFVVLYALISTSAYFAAPVFGRVALPCWSSGPLQSQSLLYCMLNRHYVTSDLMAITENVAQTLETEFPGTKTLTLDGGFPLLPNFPMLPHLSHHDGEKIDLTFFYQNGNGDYVPSKTPSPIGYFGFVAGPTQCPHQWLSLRWDFNWLQPLLSPYALDPNRTVRMIELFADEPKIKKILLEPHLKESLNLSSEKIRFQGCRAARHDDHIHVQL